MATKQFYATGAFRYQHRMLKAGDGPFPMDAPTARLFNALGKITDKKPRVAKAETLSTSDGTNILQDMADAEATLRANAAPKPKRRRRAK